MTKIINENIMYIDDANDVVSSNIEEVRSSVSYSLNSTTKNLTLNAPLDYEIKLIDGVEKYVYGYPEKWELDYRQGNGNEYIENVVPNTPMTGNCGIVCCLNILYMSGKIQDVKQSTLGDYDYNELSINNVAKNSGLTDDIGTTNPDKQQKILALYGIDSSKKKIYSSNMLAEYIKEGRSIIISVNLNRLLETLCRGTNDSASFILPDHSVVITGVVYNKENLLEGFYICNTSGGEQNDQSIYLKLSEFEYVTLGFNLYECVVTEPIKTWNKDIDGTGNSLDNIIKGTSGNNVIKGEGGDDVLVGGEGKDEIYGGADDDVLIAGVAKKTNQSGEKEDLSNEELKGLINQKTNIVVENFESEKGIGSNLYGGEGNDLLIGDKGNDVLVAGEGEDYLYGGAGRDILCNYEESARLYGGYGKDRYNLGEGTTNIIRDTDNKGTVHLNQYWVRGAEALFYLGSNVWHKDNITYTWNEDAKILTIQKDGDAGITTIENYENGALCITLEKPWSNPINADGIQSDPLIFDLNGDGIKTSLSPHQGIYYDYNNDGFAEKLSWSAYGDGVLVADTNNDGKIQGSGDILTSLTLASYDTNFDGKINYQDEYFNNLKIMDEEYNLYSLEEAGISSINLDYQNVNFTEENGNECKKIATYTKTNGQELQYGEYLVQTNPQNAIELNKLEETEAVSALPDIDNSGTVYSLHQAMLRDNELQTLVTSFTTETNDNVRMNLLEQIILKWTGAENVETDSRGDYINAQHLAVIEAFEGIDFYSEYDAQYGEEGTNPSNPNKVRRLVRRLGFNSTELIEREESKVA